MRIRGRRVAWLLASALPLLAEENPISPPGRKTVPDNNLATADTDEIVVQQSQEEQLGDVYRPFDDDENDVGNEREGASEAIYSDGFRLPPLPGSSSKQTMSESPQILPRAEDDSSMLATEIDSLPEAQEGDSKAGKKPPDPTAPDASSEGDTVIEEDDKSKEDEPDPELETYEQDEDLDEDISGEAIENKNDLNQTSTEVLEASNKTTTSAGTENPLEESAGSEQHDTTAIDNDDDEDASLSRVSVDYASKSAGALIIEKSSGFKGTSNLLNGDKDRYAISPCENKKFVVISLSEDILVKQIKLANYERFSSTVKDFQVMGSQTLGKWADLGTYSAKPGNGEQTFDLSSPAWARYLKFKFLSHHGVEYYCTFSQIKVHGSTMVQGFHEQWEESKDDEDEDNDESTATDVESENEKLMEAVGEAVEGLVNSTEPVEQHAESESSPQPENESANPGGAAPECPESAEKTADQEVCKLSPSKELGDKLNGAVGLSDDELLSSLYDLIPSTLNTLPKTSRNSPGRQTSGGVLRTLHEMESLAMQSLYATSRKAADAAMSLVSHTSDEETITNPRMSERVGDAIFHYLGTELGLLSGMLEDPKADEDVAMPKETTDSIAPIKVEEKKVENEASQSAETPSISPGISSAGADTKASDSEVKSEPSPKSPGSQQEVQELPGAAEYSLDPGLIKMLENLPSAECLSKLDFSEFKARMTASKKTHNPSGATSSSGAAAMEPIFKKLTDEIKFLQNSLSVHDNFAKTSAACYQRILLDLILESERLRNDHEVRLRKLEKDYFSSPAGLLWKFCLSCAELFWKIMLLVSSAVSYICSPLLKWLASVARAAASVPGALVRRMLLQWPPIKDALLSNSDGSTSDMAKYIRPLTDQMDLLVEGLTVSDANQNIGDVSSKIGDDVWIFPILPIMLLVLLGRVIMCFTNPPAKLSKLPSNSELHAWRTKNALSGRNNIVVKSTSPTSKTSASGGTGNGESEIRKARTRSISGADKEGDDPPSLVSETTPGKPSSLAESKEAPPTSVTP
mmetsp:Transcript_18365/g.53032  ORF Transcript_18365/g.53032 Transcript_18365/m.53032 type:complete len:1033 (+) Transcript_18365:139-3237(+)